MAKNRDELEHYIARNGVTSSVLPAIDLGDPGESDPLDDFSSVETFPGTGIPIWQQITGSMTDGDMQAVKDARERPPGSIPTLNNTTPYDVDSEFKSAQDAEVAKQRQRLLDMYRAQQDDEKARMNTAVGLGQKPLPVAPNVHPYSDEDIHWDLIGATGKGRTPEERLNLANALKLAHQTEDKKNEPDVAPAEQDGAMVSESPSVEQFTDKSPIAAQSSSEQENQRFSGAAGGSMADPRTMAISELLGQFDKLKALQAEARRKHDINAFGRVGDELANTFIHRSGTHVGSTQPSSFYDALDKNADRPVNDELTRLKAAADAQKAQAMSGYNAARTADLTDKMVDRRATEDPNSPESRVAQQVVAEQMPSLAGEPNLQRQSMADILRMSPILKGMIMTRLAQDRLAAEDQRAKDRNQVMKDTAQMRANSTHEIAEGIKAGAEARKVQANLQAGRTQDTDYEFPPGIIPAPRNLQLAQQVKGSYIALKNLSNQLLDEWHRNGVAVNPTGPTYGKYAALLGSIKNALNRVENNGMAVTGERLKLLVDQLVDPRQVKHLFDTGRFDATIHELIDAGKVTVDSMYEGMGAKPRTHSVEQTIPTAESPFKPKQQEAAPAPNTSGKPMFKKFHGTWYKRGVNGEPVELTPEEVKTNGLQ